MVSKTLAAVVAFAMIAGSAQASMQLEHFLTFANDPTASNFKLTNRDRQLEAHC